MTSLPTNSRTETGRQLVAETERIEGCRWKKKMERWSRGAILISVLLNSAATVTEAQGRRKGMAMNERIKKDIKVQK